MQHSKPHSELLFDLVVGLCSNPNMIRYQQLTSPSIQIKTNAPQVTLVVDPAIYEVAVRQLAGFLASPQEEFEKNLRDLMDATALQIAKMKENQENAVEHSDVSRETLDVSRGIVGTET